MSLTCEPIAALVAASRRKNVLSTAGECPVKNVEFNLKIYTAARQCAPPRTERAMAYVREFIAHDVAIIEADVARKR